MSKHLETLIGTLWSSLRHEAARRRDWLRLAASLPPGASLGWRTEVEGGAISLGERTRIENNASLHCPLRGSDRCHIRIGAHCRVWPGVGLYSAGGWIEIGDYSSLNSHVLVYGRGSVIAAGAVVTKNVEPFSVMAGVPAHLLKRRGSLNILPEQHA